MQVNNYRQSLSFHYERANQLPEQCLFAIKLLEAQPLFDGVGSTVYPCKVIPLDSFDDARIFDIFHRIATVIIGEKFEWCMHDFGSAKNQLMDAEGKLIEQGLHLWLYSDKESCSLETLKLAYSQVYDAMRRGWVESNPEDYQNIMVKEDSEKFTLFIKKDKISEEDILIRFLTSKFGLKGQVKCDSVWLNEEGGYDHGKIYMWINKENLSKIMEKFGFKF